MLTQELTVERSRADAAVKECDNVSIVAAQNMDIAAEQLQKVEDSHRLEVGALERKIRILEDRNLALDRELSSGKECFAASLAEKDIAVAAAEHKVTVTSDQLLKVNEACCLETDALIIGFVRWRISIRA